MLIAGLKEEGTVFKTSLLVPLAIPVASIVLLWKLFFHPQGMVNQITALFGMAGIDWINGDTAFGVLVFTYVWKNLGYDVVLWVAGLAAISDELYEAARVDGAGILARFLYVTLPGDVYKRQDRALNDRGGDGAHRRIDFLLKGLFPRPVDERLPVRGRSPGPGIEKWFPVLLNMYDQLF